jgi:glycosyl transferase family 11
MSANLILRLKGGLGNQLFQYAAARSISHRNQAPLLLDTYTGFASDVYARRFRLNYFDIRAELLPEQECVRKFAEYRVSCKLRSYRERWFIRFGRAFDPFTSHLHLGRDVVLEGYWQSERYFRDIGDVLRKELRVVETISPESAELAVRIREEGGVAVHVRRLHGVSANGAKVEGRYGGKAADISPGEYYQRSIEHIRRLRGGLSVFVFADSPEWARENIRFDCPTCYVSHNGPERDYEDLLLMATCRDHVIANSSFSWWGAWLGESPDKIVCAPRNFSPYQAMRPLRDVYPPSWVVI